MILLNATQSRELDRISQDKYGIPSYSLMTRAGEAVADALVDRFPDAATDVLIVAGKGNNGGDGFVAGRWLIQDGFAVRAVLLGDCDEATRLVGEGEIPSLDHRARYRRDGAYAATLCTKAVDVLFQATGGGAIYARNPLQRAFRDVHAANAHYVLNWDINGTMYGRVALGLSPDATL